MRYFNGVLLYNLVRACRQLTYTSHPDSRFIVRTLHWELPRLFHAFRANNTRNVMKMIKLILFFSSTMLLRIGSCFHHSRETIHSWVKRQKEENSVWINVWQESGRQVRWHWHVPPNIHSFTVQLWRHFTHSNVIVATEDDDNVETANYAANCLSRRTFRM